MFSVLIVEKSGNKRLREDALEVRHIATPIKRDDQIVTDKGVLVRWSDGIETHFGPTKYESIFVMNRYGATVATYRP